MTNSTVAKKMGVMGTAKSPRTANTLRLHLLMEAQRKIEIATRITELRERSPFTQPEIAEELGITLRAYQKVEQKGTADFERCQELFAIHKDWAREDPTWSHLSAGWIWDGTVRETSVLDGLSELEPATVDQLKDSLAELVETTNRQAEELVLLRKGQEDLRSRVERLEHGGEGSGS